MRHAFPVLLIHYKSSGVAHQTIRERPSFCMRTTLSTTSAFHQSRVSRLFAVLCAIFVLGASFSIFPTHIAHAVWNGMPYNPEQTLDPQCSPTIPNCRVIRAITVGEGIPSGSLPYTSGTDGWTTLPIGADGKVLKIVSGALAWANDDGGIAYSASEQGIHVDPNSHVFSVALDGSSLSTSGNGLRLSSSYAGQASITTLGTIASGTWQGTPVAVGYGGTGATAMPTNGQLLIGNGSGYTVANATGSGGVTLTAGGGSLDIGFSIPGLTAVTSAANNDYVTLYQSSSGTNKKIAVSDLLATMDGSLNYQGTWNANANTPTLTNGSCTLSSKGYYYVVSTSGTTTLGAVSTWNANDWAICDGTAWSKINTTNTVTSVFGRVGTITPQSGDYTASQITNTATGTISATNVQAAINELATEKENAIATGTTAQYWRGDKTWQALDTSAVAENSLHLYYTDARSRSALSSASASLSYSTTTGVFAVSAGYSIPHSGTTSGDMLVWNGSDWVPSTMLSTGSGYLSVAGIASSTGLVVNGTATTTSLSVTNGATIAGLTVSGPAVFGTTATSSFSSTGALTLSTALMAGSGGTGITNPTPGGLLMGTGGSWLQIATSTLGIALSDTTGVLTTTRGGTGTTTLALNGLVYGNGSGALQVTSAGPSGTVLVGGSGAPSFTSSLSLGTSLTSPIINATNALQLNGVNINASGTLSNVGYLSQAQTFTALQQFAGSASSTGLTVSGATYLATGNGNVGVGTSTPTAKLTVIAGAGLPMLSIGSSTAAKFVVDANGFVGIGITSPAYPLDVKGDVGGTVARFQTSANSLLCTLSGITGLLSCSSDERLKKDITPLSDSTLASVLALRPVSYHWKTDADSAGLKYGFIAQDVEKIFPELVMTDPASGFKELSLNGFVPYLTKAIQSQQAQIQALAAGVAASTGSGVSLSSLNELAISGGLSVAGHVTFGMDTVGEALMLPGDTMTAVTFAHAYDAPPIVTITPQGDAGGTYWITDVTPAGFSIQVHTAPQQSLTFSWHAFAKAEELLIPLPVALIGSSVTSVPTERAEVAPASTTTTPDTAPSQPVSSSSTEIAAPTDTSVATDSVSSIQ